MALEVWTQPTSTIEVGFYTTANISSSSSSSNLTAIVDPCADSGIGSEVAEHALRFIGIIIFVLVYVVGLAGNATLAFTILANKWMRTKSNVFVVSLAIGDFLLILITVPMAMQRYITDSWNFGDVLCKVSEFLQTLSLAVSVLTLTALSGDRLIAIVFPLYGYKTGSLRRVVWIAATIWIASTVLSLPDLIGAQTLVGCGGMCTVCRAYPSDWTVNGLPYRVFRVIFRFVAFFALPLLIITVFYVAIAVKLLRQPNAHNTTKSLRAGRYSVTAVMDAVQKQQDHRRKIANVVLLFVAIFAVCWLPVHVFTFIKTFGPPGGCFTIYWVVFDWMSRCLVFVYSAANPFALYVINNDFRRYFDHYLFGRCCKSRRLRLTDRRSTLTSSMIQLPTARNISMEELRTNVAVAV